MICKACRKARESGEPGYMAPHEAFWLCITCYWKAGGWSGLKRKKVS